MDKDFIGDDEGKLLCDSTMADELEYGVSTDLFDYTRVIGLHEQALMMIGLANASVTYQRFISCKFFRQD